MQLPNLTPGTGALTEFLSQSGPVAKTVLVILLLMSIFSWALILKKWGTLRRVRRQTRRFLQAFHKAGRLPEMHTVVDGFRPSPMVEVFESGYEEMTRQRGGVRAAALERAVRAAITDQITALEDRLGWLATIAGASPFIGLFGTVWGIINAFHGLAAEGAATLRAVAPGISEALVTTAAGLFAAVPALIAYNVLSNQVKVIAATTDEFGLELINRLEETAGTQAEETAAGYRPSLR